jgi:hypothetical protein
MRQETNTGNVRAARGTFSRLARLGLQELLTDQRQGKSLLDRLAGILPRLQLSHCQPLKMLARLNWAERIGSDKLGSFH